MSIVADLNRGEKLNGQNYDMWHRKIQYLLNDLDVLETLTSSMVPPEKGTTAQHTLDQNAFDNWVKKDRCARFTMLSSMHNDLIGEFENFPTAQSMWSELKIRFGQTSATRLRALNLKFMQCTKDPSHSMAEHLRAMSSMIRDLKNAGCELTDEQQVLAVIRSLPDPEWAQMKLLMTHSEHIKTFTDISRHLELEAERVESARPKVFVTRAGPSRPKNKRKGKADNKAGQGSGQKREPKPHRGRRGTKRNVAKMRCYNCGLKGHLARDCTEPKQVPFIVSSLSVCSYALVAHTLPDWIVDTGANKHVVRERTGYVDFHRIPADSQYVVLGNGLREQVLGVGVYRIRMRNGYVLLLHDVLYVPTVQCNLCSVLALLTLGYSFNFSGNKMDVYLNNKFVFCGQFTSGFFRLDVDLCDQSSSFVGVSFPAEDDSLRWHSRLGHVGQDRMSRLAKEGLMGPLSKINLPVCEHCLAGKACRKPFGRASRVSHPLELVHSDICGPVNVKARHGASYFLTFIDDYSRFGYVYLISHRYEVLDCFKRFLAEVENQQERTLKTLRTDRGREYLSEQFRMLCEEKGICRQLTVPGTPQQNGVAERRNRTLLDMVRSMMAQANLPISFWGDALLTAAYILNRIPSKSVPSTPYELWTGAKPILDYLRPWGSAGFVHHASHRYGKLGPRASRHVFIRYPEDSKGYVMYGEHPDGGMTEVLSRDVEFIENEFPSIGEIKKDLQLYELQEDSPIIIGEGGGSVPLQGVANDSQESLPSGSAPMSGSALPESSPQGPSFQLRRSERGIVPRRRFEIEGDMFLCTSQDIDEPASVSEALNSPARTEWLAAMEEEMQSMAKNHVWELVDLPSGRKSVGTKWVLKIKRKADGSIDKYKARLVAKGYTQMEGVDYEETFSPVVRFASVRLILAIVAHLDLELHQMDVKTAFLNGGLDEEIYMDQPIGFITKGQEGKVCRLKRSIYGLKQSSRQWYFRFHEAITSVGMDMIEEDHCVYVKRSENGILILSLYVDDILIAGSNMEMINATKEWLSSIFEMKDMGEANYVLGVKILRNRSKRFLGLSQETYIKKILERFQMHNSKPVDTPIEKACTLSLDQCPKTDEERNEMSRVPYANAVGSLMYAVMCTRPDICFAVGLVSRYQSNPGPAHWRAVKRIFRYLRGTSDFVLCYGAADLRLRGFCDADWAGDIDERRSTSGYVFILGGGAVSWCSKKQSCIALSTMEAEYVACSAAVQEAVWLRRFLRRLEISASAGDPVQIRSDSMAALQYAKDPKYHGRTKHIDIRYHYIRDMVKQGEVTLQHIPTSRMVADPLTKPVARDVFQFHVKNLGLCRL